MKNLHNFFRFIRFLTIVILLTLTTGCFLFEESEEEKSIRRTRKFSDNLIAYGLLAQNSNECLERANINITEGQTLGPYTEDLCFKISISGNTSVNMITFPGTTSGILHVWSSDAIPSKRTILREDDPSLPITGPGIWYANMYCDSICNSYTISIP